LGGVAVDTLDEEGPTSLSNPCPDSMQVRICMVMLILNRCKFL